MWCWCARRNFMLPRTLAAWAGLTLSALSGYASEAWLKPERFVAELGATLRFEIFSDHRFPLAPNAPLTGRGYHATCFMSGVPIRAELIDQPATQSNFLIAFIRPGTALVAVELEPSFTELSNEDIEVRFRELHAGEALREIWARQPAATPWRERHAAHIKGFVRVGEPGATRRDWAKPIGATLEIVPEQDPLNLRIGDYLGVKILRAGVPLENFAVNFVAADQSQDHVVFTDLNGRAQITLEANGLWLIHGTDLQLAVKPEREETWVSDFASLVIQVQ